MNKGFILDWLLAAAEELEDYEDLQPDNLEDSFYNVIDSPDLVYPHTLPRTGTGANRSFAKIL